MAMRLCLRYIFLFSALCSQFLSEVEFCLITNTLQNYRALFSSVKKVFKENINASLTFPVCRKQDSKYL